jgi:hypothetical protein
MCAARETWPQKRANDAAAHHASAPLDRRYDLGFEPHLPAELRQQLHIAGLAITEAEVVPHQHGADAEPFHQQLPYEVLRREPCDLRGEGQDQNFRDAFLLHQLGAMRGRGEQNGRAIGRHHLSRMGIERKDSRLPTACGGQRHHLLQDAAMAEVYAIEIADGESARAEIGGHLVEAAEQAHGNYSTVTSSPS